MFLQQCLSMTSCTQCAVQIRLQSKMGKHHSRSRQATPSKSGRVKAVSLVLCSYVTPSNALAETLRGSRKAARECAEPRRALAEPDCLQLVWTDHLPQKCAKTPAGGVNDMYSCLHSNDDRRNKGLPDAASLHRPRSDLVLAFCLCMPCWPALAGQQAKCNCKFRLGNIHRRPERVTTVKANDACNSKNNS